MLAKQELDLELCDFERDVSIAVGAGGSELFEVVVCVVEVLSDILSAKGPLHFASGSEPIRPEIVGRSYA